MLLSHIAFADSSSQIDKGAYFPKIKSLSSRIGLRTLVSIAALSVDTCKDRKWSLESNFSRI